MFACSCSLFEFSVTRLLCLRACARLRRALDCDIRVQLPAVSKRHARLYVSESNEVCRSVCDADF